MKTNDRILKSRFNAWPFLVITLLLRHLSDNAIHGRDQTIASMSLAQLQASLREEPDEYIWHDRLSDEYFMARELKRSLFHRREAMRILEQLEFATESNEGSS